MNMTDDYIPLAMLNALAYCPRRFGYEFIQSEMLLNEHVVEGQLRHQGVDLVGTNWLAEAVQERRVYVWSERLRIAGFCDLVELKAGAMYPVEYKKGRLGRWRNDHIQLAAQAICLEERTGQTIERGYIFSFAARRREEVVFSAELRSEVERIAAEAHRLSAEGRLPPPIAQRSKCRDCSLEPLCLPDELQKLATFDVGGDQHV
ncbi:MAG: CRISPR-associated protein Cas4 [Candidatus Viridilinea halotolerans]|uniref:CRISPR-associated exonuclease Cas4 n=1 Tax=Candidatus Viridilinea halotolerans TaxID=2491704 RepID=A0A426TTZ4_9CHLR|nr:MAG: CRISPR-associated protein Cas4 [Candidatus Viridilinea halotolerans]